MFINFNGEPIDLSKINIKSISIGSELYELLPITYKTQVLRWNNFGEEPTKGLQKYFK